jgi:replicative DNA helicase
VTLRDELRRRGELDRIGGSEAIEAAVVEVPHSSSATYYARIVADRAAVRAVRSAAQTILRAIDGDIPLTGDEARAVGSREIAKAVEWSDAKGAQWVGDLVTAEEARLDDPTPDNAVTTGFDQLDEKTNGGWRAGQLVILAARPGVGKTSLAMQHATAAALRGPGALVLTFEMSADELSRLLLGQGSGVSPAAIRRRRLYDGQRQGVNAAANRFRAPNSRLWIDDGARTLVDIQARARQFVRQQGLGVVVVDYLQLVDPGKERREENRAEAVGRLSRGLKMLARDLGIAVIALAQFNRALESREGHKPRLSDLRESGSIEQDADIVMAIHRETNPSETKGNPNAAELILLKHRGGPVGVIPFRFDPATQLFTESFGGAR